MKRLTLLIGALVLLSVFNLALTIIPENAAATTRFVGGGGPGNFTTIQDAINASAPGDTVFVYSGTYFENVVVDETLNLIGEDMNTTVVDGGGTGDVVSIVADWVNLSSITVMNSGPGYYDGGIDITSSSNNLISNITALNNRMGILLLSSYNSTMIDIYEFNNTEGIHLEFSDFNTAANTTADSIRHGIVFESSHNNTVNRSNLTGVLDCISLVDSHGNFVSDSTARKCRSGILVSSSNNNTFSGNDVSWSDAIYIEDSKKNTFLNNTISHNLQGISIGYSSDLTFKGNVMIDNGFQLWGTSALEHWNSHVIDVTNTVNGRPAHYWKNVTGGAIPSDAGQVLLYNCTDVLIENQNLSAATIGAHSFISSNLAIRDNTVSSNFIGIWLENANFGNVTANNLTSDTWDILIEDSDHVNIANNFGPNNRGIWLDNSHNCTYANNSKSIQLEFSDDNVVTDNTVSGGRGFQVTDSNDNVISFNNISANWGMHLEGSFRNRLINNTVFNSSSIELEMSRNNIIHNNMLTNNGFGLKLDQSTGNSIENNTISMSNHSGMELWVLSDSNIIANNTVSSNGLYGIYIRDSFDNRAYHNNFIDNPVQAFNHINCSNEWDNGYPLGGNYWSDYNGTDLLKGPNQDQPGADGIGDTPYDIQGGNDRDRFPLVGPFETIHPLPPVILRSDLTGAAFENVTLTWNLSFDDGGGAQTVVGYRVYRNTSFSSDGSGYVLIATLPDGTSGFVDSLAGEGDPSNYFYRVCAFDIENRMRCAEDQAGKFTRPLSEGDAFASIPLIQSDEGIETVLQTASFDKAWSFDSSYSKWVSYVRFKPHLGSLQSLNESIGFWLNVTEDSNLTVAGVVPSATTIHLGAGWNLVGFPSFNSTYAVGDLVGVTGALRVEGMDMSAYPYLLKALQMVDVLMPGHACWIYVGVETGWVVQNP